jgi:hypothetical protein
MRIERFCDNEIFKRAELVRGTHINNLFACNGAYTTCAGVGKSYWS